MEIHVIQEDRDIGSVDVLTELAQDVGLNRQGFATALLERRYRQAHRVARAQARARASRAFRLSTLVDSG